jgi:hypothetical protein
MGLISLHNYIFNLLRQNIKQKQTFRQRIFFLKNVCQSYFKILLQEYKRVMNFLDPHYRQENEKRKKYNQYRKDIFSAWKIIQWMIKQGETRHDRKNIRRDFEKHGRISKELERAILKDIYGVKEE